MCPIYTCFYTIGTLYEAEAARLRASLDALSLPHDLQAIPSRGDWTANSRYTARHILEMMNAYPNRPIVQLDADAVVYRRPDLLEDGITCDLATHLRRGREMLNGTMYIAPTPAARAVIEVYRDGVDAHPDDTNEQKWLHRATDLLASAFKWFDLPPSYCFIPDIMASDIGDNLPVIGQMQASRERSRCDAWQRRQRWIGK